MQANIFGQMPLDFDNRTRSCDECGTDYRIDYRQRPGLCDLCTSLEMAMLKKNRPRLYYQILCDWDELDATKAREEVNL